jgi:hypothetical protein
MRHCSASSLMRALGCAVMVSCAGTALAQSGEVSVWRELPPPVTFTPRVVPPVNQANGSPAVWNLASEFSRGGSNPAGPWAMGYSLNRFGAFTVSPDWGATLAGTFGWFTASVGLQPTVVQVVSATSFPTLGTGVFLPAGAVGLMPDSLGKFAAVRWTCAESGQYAIDALFTGRSSVEVGNSDIAVLRNGLQLFFSTVRDPRQSVLMQTTFDLTPGETLEFRVGKSNDTNLNDLKQLDVVIQRLPRLCPGDINGDGVVNIQDLTTLLGSFGQDVIPSEGGDLNGDGTVNINDLSLLVSNLGCTV